MKSVVSPIVNAIVIGIANNTPPLSDLGELLMQDNTPLLMQDNTPLLTFNS